MPVTDKDKHQRAAALVRQANVFLNKAAVEITVVSPTDSSILVQAVIQLEALAARQAALS
jgi:hypothetical protein